jgi:hypothetical protein
MVVSTFNYPAMQQTADELIAYFGMAAVLRSLTASRPDRPCMIAIMEYNPREKPNEMANPTDRKIVMSPLDPTTGLELVLPPDDELDALVTVVQPAGTVENEVLPMTCKPKKTSPAGIDCLWEFTVRR